MKKSGSLLFGLLMTTLIPLELLGAHLAYETIGEIASHFLYILVISLNFCLGVLALRHKTAAALGAFILALMIVPYQLLLGQRLLRVQAEATRIIAYAYEQKLNMGEFPTDLTRYEFQDAEMKTFIQGYQQDDQVGGFILFYRVGTDFTSHSYSPKNGWYYYPD